jgi:N,N-dimethylformamidase
VTNESKEAVLPITGYLDPMSARQGESISVKVSAAFQGTYDVDTVRIISADPNPEGPGVLYEPRDFGLKPTYRARSQNINIGSYAVVPGNVYFTGEVMLFTVLVQPWLLKEETSVIASALDSEGVGWQLSTKQGKLVFSYQAAESELYQVELSDALKYKIWHQVWAGYDVSKSRLILGVRDLKDEKVKSLSESRGLAPLPDNIPLVFAARKTESISTDHFNGRLEDPAFYNELYLEPGGLPHPDKAPSGAILAWWDFAIGIDTQSIVDRGPFGLSGRLINIPYRGMSGARWSGNKMDWQKAPREYAAIHFHEDDLYDCGWETDFQITIPSDTPSGVYGVRLKKDDSADILPFYVLPNKIGPKNKICFLASTFTHQAYTNHARGNCDAEMRTRMQEWGASPFNPDDYPIYGRSTYNFHPDGTGISISSRLRPALTVRPGYITFTDKAGSGLRHFSADTHLLYWLEKRGISFDVVTDEDLDDEGSELLASYDTILTGSHPEYHTAKMLDSLQSYVDSGGNLVYLGGNGFYWKITRVPTLPGVIELRRAEGGIRAWSPKPGESHHQLDGGYGGLWRRNGRPPQKLVGVGFSAQGLFESSYYKRTRESYDEDVSWIFDGVSEEKLGDYGFSGGGAAGFELDRADQELGSPSETVILAVSENHSDSFIAVPEELLTHINTETGENPEDLVRAEIVYCPKPNGGAIFSVGSICFCGSLNHNAGDNGVSKMLENVIRRFASL